MEKTFKENDKLNRKKYGEFIYKLIKESNKLKKEECNSFTLAIDGAWGCGKTTFLDMFTNEYNNDGSENNNDKDLLIIRYNAWENDYTNNAFQSLIYTIFSDEAFYFATSDANTKEAFKTLTNGIIDEVGNLFSPIKMLNIIARSLIEGSSDSISYTNDFSEEHKKINEIKNKIKKCLQEYIGDKKLVVIIDELDRCKPLFAIETLETVKHLFDINNLTFIFSLDICQLQYSIKKIYGDGFDSYGYLNKFFDYISTMPKVYDYKEYIKKEISKILDSNIIGIKDQLADRINYLCRLYDLTMRELDIVLKNYKLLCVSFLNDYHLTEAHELYIGFLMMKYKKREWYNMLFVDNRAEEFFEMIKRESNELTEYYYENDFNNDHVKHLILKEKMNILLDNEIRDTGNVIYFGNENMKFNKTSNYCHILFFNDLKDIAKNQIEYLNEMTFAQYIGMKLDVLEFNEELLDEKKIVHSKVMPKKI